MGKTKALQSSYLFLMIVPVFAKALAKLPAYAHLEINHVLIPIHMRLPFSWVLLFWCAFFVTIGNVIYQIWCPEIVKRFRGFDEFKNSGVGAPYLQRKVRGYFMKETEDTRSVDAAVTDVSLHWDLPATELTTRELSGLQEITGPTFHFAREPARTSWPLLRLVATISYILGFTFLGIIFLANLIFVCRYLWGNFVQRLFG